MDKAILKKFAIESRQDLMEKIKNKINTFYIDEDFKSEQKGELYILSNEKHSLSLTNDEFKKRELLIKRIKELSLEQVIEEAAYTWFNRIIAIRYMEINDMLPLTRDNQSLGIRVLSSKDNTPDPEILKFTNLMNPDLDIDFKKEKYAELKDDNEKFKYILLLVCKKIGRVIPQVFDGITDYIDILIPDNLLNDTGFITKVINEVPENNYNQVEIIGWLYQYYNQTEKDRVISSKKAYKKNEIPYATQLFTTDWIVRYMVDNTLGKMWIEHNPNSNLKNKLKYFIDKNLEYKNKNINIEKIKFIDPCCGSGHILVYAFELFFEMYLEQGYFKNDIPKKILLNNIYGLDIDDRAGQLSILSVILKAREYDKNIFNENVIKNINIMSIQETSKIDINIINYLDTNLSKENAKYLIDSFKDAKEIGSLLCLEKKNYDILKNEILKNQTIFGIELNNKIIPLIRIADILTSKFDVIVTNPPYINSSSLTGSLKKYIQTKFENFRYDLFSAFIKRNSMLGNENSYLGFMTPNVWMFISSYEKLREFIINEMNIDSLIQLAKGAFFKEATVDICTFILSNNKNNKLGNYFRLENYKGDMIVQENAFIDLKENPEKDDYYEVETSKFTNFPGYIIGYWVTDNIVSAFKNGKLLGNICAPRQGLATTNNDLFLRNWFEININDFFVNCKNAEESLNSDKKWYPYNKGGFYRKWYGNCEYVINWKYNGKDLKYYIRDKNPNVARGEKFYFKRSISWSKISSGSIAFRYFPIGFIFDVAGCSIFIDDDEMFDYIFALINSCVSEEILKCISPTLNYEAGQIQILPILIKNIDKTVLSNIIKSNIDLAKEDWDSFETSWDFATHPLIEYKSGAGYGKDTNCWDYKIKDAYNSWKSNCDEKFKLLKQNEEELNRIFIDIYGLQDELTPEVDDKDITIRKSDRQREIKSLISYAVGCMFGRYSIDEDGLIYAGGEFKREKYKMFKVDEDNIIPITDEAYFGDDIVERFKAFIKVVYGDNTFNENMDFIAEALGKKGTETSEDTIRRYFVNDFFNDHVKIYQKRPIYWLFDSGKKNGFKALVYMHRYNENLIPKVRLDYLHRIQTTYEKLLSDISYKLTTELSMSDKKAAQNRQADLNAKLQEIKEYDEKIAHIANQRISIDLDDGVKVNYDKFKDILARIK